MEVALVVQTTASVECTSETLEVIRVLVVPAVEINNYCTQLYDYPHTTVKAL